MRLLFVVAIIGCSATSPEPKSNTVPKGEIAESASGRRDSFTQVEYATHIKRLRAKLRAVGLGELKIRIEDPFVVIGDGGGEALARSSGTVRWAADKLEQDFFATRPTKIVDIFLFSTAASYEAGVQALTGESPSTPYGFYSPTHVAMFMNIATGGGTLVHEIVHPYVEADFPEAPAWLNEGLGSLFEQSAEREGRIVGLPNWRLGGLQRTIERGELPPFRTLTHLPHNAFYGDETGTNYAQSRYLMYYLQEQGKLRGFYHAFRAARDEDPTGYKALVAALEVRDMAAFTRRWEAYVMDLAYP
jgi:hypothetical protein